MIQSLIHSMIVCPDMKKTYPKISYGKGPYLFDEEGKKYLDASSGSAAVSNIGHGITEIAQIIKEQTEKISVLPTHAFSSTVVEEERLNRVSCLCTSRICKSLDSYERNRSCRKRHQTGIAIPSTSGEIINATK